MMHSNLFLSIMFLLMAKSNSDHVKVHQQIKGTGKNKHEKIEEKQWEKFAECLKVRLPVEIFHGNI